MLNKSFINVHIYFREGILADGPYRNNFKKCLSETSDQVHK